MRAAGATGLQNGVWVLPHRPDHEQFLRELLIEIERQGGHGLIFTAVSLDQGIDPDIFESFRADRDQEYTEFCERCADFFHEIEKETARQKFTFAELEENEEDLKKLADWLGKIQARDFFQGHQAEAAVAALTACRQTMDGFTQRVYAHAGLNGPESGNQSKPGLDGEDKIRDGK